MKTKTATIGFEIPSPLTFADGLEYDATLQVEVEVEIDYAEVMHRFDRTDIEATDATVSVCGVDVPATAQAAELFRQWYARPENVKRFATLVERHLPESDECPDPAYERACVNGRMILPNGRDVS